MGTPVAVAFACIHLAVIEEEVHLDLLHLSVTPILLNRYIDDIFGIFSTAEQATQFISTFNSKRTTIKCKDYKISFYSANFLDLTISKPFHHEPNDHIQFQCKDLIYLRTTLYQKPTNKFLFLPPSSSHNPKIYTGWISSYIKRIRINCSNIDDFLHYCKDFFNQLTSRGYNPKTILPIFMTYHDRNKLLDTIKHRKQDQTQKPTVVFKLKYCPRTAGLVHHLKHALKYPRSLKADPHFKEIFGSRSSPLICWTKDKSFKDTLIRAELDYCNELTTT